jgi:hypothetical protein
MLCARVMRGTSSRANVVILPAARRFTMSTLRCGDMSPTRMAPGFMASASCLPRSALSAASAILMMMSAVPHASWRLVAILAPAAS